MQRLWIGLGALAGFAAVALAAASAHGLDADARALAATAVQMQFWHALALLGVGLWSPRGGRLADAAGLAFGLGMLAFCGAIYGHAFAGVAAGPLAPIGGSALMLGWLLLAASALRARA